VRACARLRIAGVAGIESSIRAADDVDEVHELRR
jgi:hypothetical protein